MSKLKLKKELSSLSKDEIIEVVARAYSARKEFRDYFEFFLNPDADKLYEKYRDAILREIGRGQRKSKARISEIKKLIKNFDSFDAGAEYGRNLRLFAIDNLIDRERYAWYSDTLINGTARLTLDLIDFADKNGLVDSTMKMLEKNIGDTSRGNKNFKKFILHAIERHTL